MAGTTRWVRGLAVFSLVAGCATDAWRTCPDGQCLPGRPDTGADLFEDTSEDVQSEAGPQDVPLDTMADAGGGEDGSDAPDVPDIAIDRPADVQAEDVPAAVDAHDVTDGGDVPADAPVPPTDAGGLVLAGARAFVLGTGVASAAGIRIEHMHVERGTMACGGTGAGRVCLIGGLRP